MIQTFADTFYYLALLNPDDEAHEKTLTVTAQRSGMLVTTRWILTEVGDAMAAPCDRQRFLNLASIIESDPNTIIVPTTDELYWKGVTFFGNRSDKSWSLTDCISFVVMEEHRIIEALTDDHHFEQAGFTALLAK